VSSLGGVPLELSEVGLTYPSLKRQTGPVEAVREVSLVLRPGMILGLAGPNGAGKTTLIEMCVGALKPSSGRISWFGNSKIDGETRRRIGFCPDVPALPQRLTGREVLQFFAALDGDSGPHIEARIDYLAERLRVQAALEQLVGALSRGTLQRLGILQALVHERDILLCDESFAPLDPIAQVDLRLLLQEEARRGAAILVSSHQLDQLGKIADEVAIMKNGSVARYLKAGTLKARRVINLQIAAVDGEQLAQVYKDFPEGWLTGHTFRVPWHDEKLDERVFRESFPSVAGAGAITIEQLSLESIFLDAVA